MPKNVEAKRQTAGRQASQGKIYGILRDFMSNDCCCSDGNCNVRRLVHDLQTAAAHVVAMNVCKIKGISFMKIMKSIF